MKEKTVLVVHNNKDFINKLDTILGNTGLYKITGIATDGEELLKLKSLNAYDIVLAKNAVSYVTGLYALETLLKNSKQYAGQIILLTPFLNDFVQNKCEELGIHCVNASDLDVNKIPDLLYNSEFNKPIKKSYFDVQYEIIALLKNLGILRTYVGYKYFEYILNIMFEKSEYIYKPMREMYENIAHHFNTTSVSVEKAMRLCIKSSLNKNNNYYSRLLFGSSEKNFPSTSIFIQVCVKTLKEEKNNILQRTLLNQTRKI